MRSRKHLITALWFASAAFAYSQQPRVLTIQEAEELLVNRSIALAAAKDQVAIAAAARRVAGLRPNPNLHFGAEQLPVHTNVPGHLPNFYRTNPDGGANPTYNAELEMLFERGGKRQLRAEQADAVVDAAKAQVIDTLREQLYLLRSSFTDGLLAKENLALAQETDSQYAETERLMEIRLRGGEIAEIDLDRVKAARLPFMQAVIEAKLAYNQARRKVANLLGIAGTDAPELEGSLQTAPPPPPLQELLDSVSQRPDVLVARHAERAAERGLRLAEAQRKRDITGSVSAQRNGYDYAVGGGVSLPLFWFNNQKAAIAQADAGRKLAATQLLQAERQARGEVERAYEGMLAGRQALDLFTADAIERSRRVRSIINYSYQRGEADLLEVLDAQRSANQILTGYNQARANYMNAIWQLENAVGRPF